MKTKKQVLAQAYTNAVYEIEAAGVALDDEQAAALLKTLHKAIEAKAPATKAKAQTACAVPARRSRSILDIPFYLPDAFVVKNFGFKTINAHRVFCGCVALLQSQPFEIQQSERSVRLHAVDAIELLHAEHGGVYTLLKRGAEELSKAVMLLTDGSRAKLFETIECPKGEGVLIARFSDESFFFFSNMFIEAEFMRAAMARDKPKKKPATIDA
jgi:hypothetical protein